MRQRTYYVYILASHSRRLYIGVTNNLLRRVWEHRAKLVNGFSWRYCTISLVFFEMAGDARSAIAREKQLKNWRREKKMALIERDNAWWRDLAAGWFESASRAGDVIPSEPQPGTRVAGARGI